MKKELTRSEFLRQMALLSGGVGLGIAGIPGQAYAQLPTGLAGSVPEGNVLVIIQLAGGNDGLNTVIPAENDTYFSKRPDIAIKKVDALALKNGMYLHPSMTGIKSLYDQGNVAVVQSVGYANPNRSHFRATDIWNTGSDANVVWEEGWAARYLAEKYPSYPIAMPSQPMAIQLGSVESLLFQSDIGRYGTVFEDPNLFYQLVSGTLSDDEIPPATLAGDELAFLKQISTDDIEITTAEITKLEEGATTIKFENRWIAKDGTVKWLVWNAAADMETGYLYAVARDMTAQIETQKSLLIAETFFNMSYDMLAVGSGDYFIKINPAFTRTLGYDQSDMNHKTFLSFTHPEDIHKATEAIKSLQKGNSLINLRARARCKDGTYKWLDWTSTIDIQTGKMFAVARDVTDMVKYEESLKVADNFFDMAFDILSISKEDQFIKINPSFTTTLGYEQNDLMDIKFTDLIHSDEKKLVEDEFNKLLKGTLMINYKNRTLCKDGTYKWLDWHCNYDAKKGLIYSVARDISEETRLENEEKIIINDLYENEEKLRLILENIGEGVIVANANKEIVMANYMANEIFGITEDENIPLNITDHFDLFFPDGRTTFPSQNLPMEKALNGEITNDIDVILSDLETRERRRVLISGRPLIDQEDKVVAAVVTIKDISKYKHLEEELQEAETKYRKLIGFRKDEEKKE